MQDALHRVTLRSYLSKRPPSNVLELDTSMSVGQAMRTLGTANVLSAPCRDDSSGAYVGFFSLADVLAALLALMPAHTSTEPALLRAGVELELRRLGSLQLGGDGALLRAADLDSSLWEVVVHAFLAPLAAGAPPRHRVAVFDTAGGAAGRPSGSPPASDVGEDEDGDGPSLSGERSGDSGGGSSGGGAGAPWRRMRVTHMVSQSDVLRLLLRLEPHLHPGTMHATLEQLGLASKPLVCVPPEMSTINAYATMQAHHVSSVGVVSHEQGGALVAALSPADLRGLQPGEMGQLALPVLAFLRQRVRGGGGAQGGGRSPRSANDWGLKGAEELKEPTVATCGAGATLGDAMRQMASAGGHRVFVVDACGRPRGVVTITDVLVTLAGADGLAQAAAAAAAEGPSGCWPGDEELDDAQAGGGSGEDDACMEEGARGVRTASAGGSTEQGSPSVLLTTPHGMLAG